MIEILLKYDNMHIIGVINALNCINNHIITCINRMLSTPRDDLFIKVLKLMSRFTNVHGPYEWDPLDSYILQVII